MINSKTKITEIHVHDVGWWSEEKSYPKGIKPKGFMKGVRKAISKCKREKTSHWQILYFWRTWKNQPMEMMYGVKLFPNKKGTEAVCRVQPVFFGIPGGKSWVTENLLYSNLAGWILMWDESPKGYYSYRPSPDYTMVDAREDLHPHFWSWAVSCTNSREFLALKGLPKGFAMSQGDECDPGVQTRFEYVERWLKSPYVERLVKMGFSHLWNDGTIDRYKDRKKISELVSYMKRERKEITGQHVKFKTILAAMREGMTINKWFEEEEFKQAGKTLARFNFDEPRIREIMKYIHKQPGGYDHYADYLDASVKLKRKLTDRGVLFPRNFCKQFDSIKPILAEMKMKKQSRKIAKAAAKLGDLQQVEMGSGFSIIVPTSYGELVELGNKLHNCVGTCGYGERMADGKIVILAVYKNGKPVSCVEVEMPNKQVKKAKVLQNRGNHNAAVPAKVEKTVGAYVSMLNKAIVREVAA